MIFPWEVRDGYAGAHRPQFTDVSDEELLECEDVDEAVRLVAAAIRDDYENQIAPEWDESEIRKLVEELFESKSND